uniref:Putative ribonuclease H-like domain-containing protein n=1 Tax=Tanacetum cinerariifolium TaxID=118510 RepID=A0A6L2MXP1_TANCI|nr:putative ribonuclease H-like domain-containing protein [Tanacetum cinerariifolium]
MLLVYVLGTKLSRPRSTSNRILDAHYAGCRDTFKSTSGRTQFLGEKLMSWSSKKQDCMSLSTVKAEYRSLSACCVKVLWIRTQLTNYGFHFNKIPINSYSKSAIAISCNSVQHSRTKHIDFRYQFIKEHVEKVCACSRFQVTLKLTHLHAVKRIFRRLILWQCKKQIIVATSTAEAEYVAAANCYGQKGNYGDKLVSTARTEVNAEFHQIVDFLSTCLINYAFTVSPTIYASYIEQFLNTATSKTINSVNQIHAIVDGKAVVISESLVRSDFLFNDEDGGGDSVEKAITTDASLVSEQKSNNITKTQSTAMSNDPISQEIGSDDKPRCQETTLGDTDAQTSMEHQDDLTDVVPPTPHGSPLSGGHTPGSDKGRPNLLELMNIDTQLSNRVLALEEAKTTQDKVITILKLRVRRLEKKRKVRTSQPMKRRLFKGRVETSTDKSLGKDASKQERRNDDKTEEFNLTNGADTEVLVEDKGSGKKGGSTADQVSTARPEVSTATPSTPPITTTIFGDEDLTIAQTLIKLRSEKAKEKGVAFRDVEEPPRLTRSTTTHQPLPTVDPKDIELAQRIYKKELAELDRAQKERQQQKKATIAALTEELDEIQDRMDVDHELAVRMTHEEQEKYTIEERVRLLVEYFERRKKQLAAERVEAIRDKPPTRTQVRNRMITYLKHIDYEHEKEELRMWLTVVSDEEETADPEILSTKGNGSTSYYKSLSSMLRKFDRQDLVYLHRLVMKRFEDNTPEEKRYPLIKEIPEKMLNWKLKAKAEREDTSQPSQPLIASPKVPQMVSFIKLHILKKGEYILWTVKMEQHLAHTYYALWEVILNGNSVHMTKDEASNEIEVPPVTAQFHGIKDAKTLWAAIKTRFCGNVESKRMQKNVLKQQFEIFFVSKSEGLDKGYDRFQRILSVLEIHDVGVSTKDANQKFLRSLPSAWSNISLIMRNKPGIDNLDIDDLYNNLKVFEADIKGSSGSSSNSQNVAMLSTRVKRFYKKTRRKLEFNGKNQLVSTKPRSRDDGNAGYIGRDNGKRPVNEEDKNALVVHDGLGTYDWSYQVEKEATDFALMAFISNPLSSSSLILRKANIEIIGYQYGLESIEGQLRVHQQNEVISEEKIAVLEYEVKDKSNLLKDTQKQLDEALREKEDLKTKFENFETSSKNLTKLLDSQIGAKVKTGLGYDSQFHEKEVLDIRQEEVTETVFNNRSSDEENSLANDRFKKGEGYHAVSPPFTGNYMSPKPDLSYARLDDSIYKFKISETVTSLAKDGKDAPETSTASVEKPKEDRSSAPFIQDWETNSDNDSIFRPKRIPAKIDFVKAGKSNKHVKPVVSVKYVNPVKSVTTAEQTKKSKHFSSSPKIDRKDWNGKMTQKLGLGFGFTQKACFVCGSISYLIKDCTSHEDKMAKNQCCLPMWEKELATGNGHLQQALKIKGIIDSECSRHMTGNKAYLIDYKEINDGGFVAFGSSRGNRTDKNAGPEDTNGNACTQDNVDAGKQVSDQHYIMLPLWPSISFTFKSSNEKATNYKPTDDIGSKTVEKPVNKEDQAYRDELDRLMSQEKEASDAVDALRLEFEQGCIDQRGVTNFGSTNSFNNVSHPVNAASTSRTFRAVGPSSPHPDAFIPANTLLHVDQDDSQIPNLEYTVELQSIGIFNSTYDDDLDIFDSPVQSVGAEADFNNTESSTIVSPIPTHRVHLDHPKDQILRETKSAVQTREMAKKSSEAHALVSYIHKQRTTNHKDYVNCLFACFLSQMEPKKVSQTLDDASWVEAMQEELLQFSLQKVWRLVDLPYGKKAIRNKWVYRIKKDERGIVVSNKARLVAQGHKQEEGINYDEVFAPVAQIEAITIFLAFASYMGFIVYQVDVKSSFLYGTIEKEVYVCQPPGFIDPQFPNKVYRVEKALYGLHQAPRAWGAYILLRIVASTPIETQKPLVKDEEAADVDVNLYRSMIRSLMCLTAYRPDTCLQFVLVLGSRDSLFDLKAYSDSDYARENLDRKSTTGGCQFLGRKLISWQCKKQTIVATFTTEAEYVAAANCYRQVKEILKKDKIGSKPDKNEKRGEAEKNDIFDPEGDMVLIEKLINFDSTKDLPPPHNINPLSGSTISSSPNHLLEEFTDELALITFPPGNDDIPFDIESDLKKIKYLLNHYPIKDMDSILEDSVDEDNLADLNDNLVDIMPKMFTDEHALDYSSPPLYDDEYDDDLFEGESDTNDAYNDPFDSKREKIKESKHLIDELDLPRSSDFFHSPEYDSFLFEDFFEVDALPSTNNEDKVFNLGILIPENLFEVITRVAPDKNVKDKQEKDKIGSKPDKNGKRGEARRSQKQLQ